MKFSRSTTRLNFLVERCRRWSLQRMLMTVGVAVLMWRALFHSLVYDDPMAMTADAVPLRMSPSALEMTHPAMIASKDDSAASATAPPIRQTPAQQASISTQPQTNRSRSQSVVTKQPSSLSACNSRPDDDKVLRRIRIADNNGESLKVLCFLMTHSGNHGTRVRSILETWGSKCTKLIIATNSTDGIDAKQHPFVEIYISEVSGYKQLWQRAQGVMGYIWNAYGTQYDWFYKVDDDTYVIMENLKSFLQSAVVQRRHVTGEPLVYGHAFALSWKAKRDTFVYNRTQPTPVYDYRDWYLPPQNRRNPQVSPTDLTRQLITFVYASGGAGYVMNAAHVRAFATVASRHEAEFKSRRPQPEDAAHFMLMYHFAGIRLQSARDEWGRERFHYRQPHKVGSMKYRDTWETKSHYRIMRLPKPNATHELDELCCAVDSIAFHYVDPSLMRYMDDYLYGRKASGGHSPNCEMG